MFDGGEDGIEHIRKANKEFVVLEQRHHRLELELNKLLKRRILAVDEEFRKKTLQKEKLATKDRMNDIIRQSRLTRRAEAAP
ncbi:MAG: DUF465 domain-containing protein [Nitrospirae bacterium]|nr:DUF465 domain-containing protein [Nitrospirota bacterium]